MNRPLICAATVMVAMTTGIHAAEPTILQLWPKDSPGPAAVVKGEEADFQKPTDRLVGGKTVMKVGNVSTPQMHVFLPPAEKANGAAVVVCPGGGFNILAWDLEGTEVAEWLNGLGVTTIVCKYRVPTSSHGAPGKWQGPVNDAQRALSITRQHAAEWKLEAKKIGILGFSAGGETAARTALAGGKRAYEAVDEADKQPCGADFAILIYPGGLIDKDKDFKLQEDIVVTKDFPPTFFVHAADDPVPFQASTSLFAALQKEKVPSELHIFGSGGHGYGLRPDKDPVTNWPKLAEAWLKRREILP